MGRSPLRTLLALGAVVGCSDAQCPEHQARLTITVHEVGPSAAYPSSWKGEIAFPSPPHRPVNLSLFIYYLFIIYPPAGLMWTHHPLPHSPTAATTITRCPVVWRPLCEGGTLHFQHVAAGPIRCVLPSILALSINQPSKLLFCRAVRPESEQAS